MLRRRQTDREFMRELLLRMERSEHEHRDALHQLVAEHRRDMAAIREDLREIATDLRDHRVEWREEQRATHKTLFAMLDRLNPGGGAASA